MRRLQQLQSFEKIYAPFDGIVTARNTDLGALIQAGENSTTRAELFHLAAIGDIRVYVAVPEAYSPSIHTGDKATLTLDEYPGKLFEGTITRNSSAIDPASRTLNVEVDIANPKGELLPGAYVFVHFKVPEHSTMLMIPSNTLLFRAEGLRVGRRSRRRPGAARSSHHRQGRRCHRRNLLRPHLQRTPSSSTPPTRSPTASTSMSAALLT